MCHPSGKLFRLLLDTIQERRLNRMGSGDSNQEWTQQSCDMERDLMELNGCGIKSGKKSGETGMYMVELMIAIVVLMVGVLGSMSLIIVAIGSNGRNKQQSNSTVVAQMITEKHMS